VKRVPLTQMDDEALSLIQVMSHFYMGLFLRKEDILMGSMIILMTSVAHYENDTLTPTHKGKKSH
jgi:hypothetical protein